MASFWTKSTICKMQQTFLPNIQTRIMGETFSLGWWIYRERKSGQKIKHHENRSIRSEIYEHYLRREVRSAHLDTEIHKNGTCNSTNGRVPKSVSCASREGELGGGGWRDLLLLSFFNWLAGVWSASRPGCSTAGKRAAGIHRTQD